MGGKVIKRLGAITIEYPRLPKNMTINLKSRFDHGNPQQQKLSENEDSDKRNYLMMNVFPLSSQGKIY
jgi:hypothetical protein